MIQVLALAAVLGGALLACCQCVRVAWRRAPIERGSARERLTPFGYRPDWAAEERARQAAQHRGRRRRR